MRSGIEPSRQESMGKSYKRQQSSEAGAPRQGGLQDPRMVATSTQSSLVISITKHLSLNIFANVLPFHEISWFWVRYSKILLAQDEKHRYPISLSLDGTNKSLWFTALVPKGKFSWYLDKSAGGEGLYSVITLGFGWGSSLSTEAYVYIYMRALGNCLDYHAEVKTGL